MKPRERFGRNIMTDIPRLTQVAAQILSMEFVGGVVGPAFGSALGDICPRPINSPTGSKTAVHLSSRLWGSKGELIV